MKTLTNNAVILLAVLILFGCGGNSDDEIAITPPEEPNIDAINLAPSIPVLIYPSNELLCIDNELEFSWEASVDNEGDPISYTIQVASDVQFTNIISEAISNDTKTVILLEKGQTLFWRAIASDNQNNISNYSTHWKFYTEGEPIVNQLPFQPELVNPNLGETVSESLILLSWNGSDADNDDLMYDVYFGTTPNMPLVAEDLQTNSFEVSLTANSLYYWRIVTKDGTGGATIGPVWSFRTE